MLWTSIFWLTLTACIPLLPTAKTSGEPSREAVRDSSREPREVTFVPVEGRPCLTCPWPQPEGWPPLPPSRDQYQSIYRGDDARGKPQLYTPRGHHAQVPSFVGLSVDYAKRAAPHWGYTDVTVQPGVHFDANCYDGEVCNEETPIEDHSRLVLIVNPKIVVTVPE